ncbi:hypothetical protein [Aldersonia kunmingensis]|uniref:hypothetical protein n=1 Tax=Aldersonia kunmingensis TaxID=408066 RepID=UPI001C9E48F7|nr:hypothetical protein [Aldersonia kunmingensis]
MTIGGVQRFTGAVGVAAGAVMLTQTPLYFVYSGAPPDWNVLIRVLLSLIGITLLVPFLAGLRRLFVAADPGLEWVATMMFGAGMLYLAVSMVAQSMEAGAVIAAVDPIDPTTTGALAPGQWLLYGTTARLMSALFLFAAAYLVARTDVLPDWIGRCATALAVINLLFVPSMFFGSDAADFYSAEGWGTTALVGSLFLVWILATGVALLRAYQDSLARTASSS